MTTFASRLAAVERRYPPPAPALPRSPVALAAACGLVLDDWQHAALVSTLPRALWNCARQSGKSTVAALLALWVALTEPGSLVLLVAPAERQAAELLRKVEDLYRALGHLVPTESEGALKLELRGGSRILALPGKDGTVRSFSGVRLLVLDEASRIPDSLFHAVTPMLAVSGGRLLALSTPWGKRGWWYQAWTEGGPDWDRVEIGADQCPRLSPAFLATERATMPAWVYAAEYECKFEENEQSVFRYADVQAALSADVRPLWEVA
jgi:hypothetical protein